MSGGCGCSARALGGLWPAAMGRDSRSVGAVVNEEFAVNGEAAESGSTDRPAKSSWNWGWRAIIRISTEAMRQGNTVLAHA
jgi:hypothetical protein